MGLVEHHHVHSLPAQPPAICGRRKTSLSVPIGSSRASWKIWPSMATATPLSRCGDERRMERTELPEEMLHGRRREVELGDAPGHLREVADQHHARHAFG